LNEAVGLLEVAMAGARFIVSVDEIRALHRSGLPAHLFPFMKNPEPAHVDYFCIDVSSDEVEGKLVVFALHAVVAEWPSPEAWLAWLRGLAATSG
jgi:hypothetical protein